MRLVRQVLEVVVPQTEDGNFVPTNHRFVDVCWNVFLIDDQIKAPSVKYSTTALNKLNSIKETLLLGKDGMTRVLAGSGIGSGFYLLPTCVVTNHHVSYEGIPEFFTGTFENALKNLFSLPVEKEVLFSGSFLLRDNYAQIHNRNLEIFPKISDMYVDPISSAVGDFNYLDVSLHRLTSKTQLAWPKVLFIPSPRVLQVNDDIFTTHFPGLEKTNFSTTISGNQEDYKNWAPSDILARQVFHDYGKLCASTGKVLAPYHQQVVNEKIEWVEHSDFRNTSQNSDFIISNESVMNGSSGGCLQSYECQTINVNSYDLVEFHGIHFGGEFIKCKDCLKNIKQHLIDNNISWSDWKKCRNLWNHCSCQSPVGLTYNYSVSVHHPLFKEVYKKLILPELLQTLNVTIDDPRIARLKEYISM